MKFKLQKFEDTYGSTFWKIYSKRWWFMPWACESEITYYTKGDAERAIKGIESIRNYKYWKVEE